MAKNTIEKIWKWENKNNKPVEMTVALPAYNAKKIIWLALDSLKNQKDINFAWELICFEEYAASRDIIKRYAGVLPGCVRIVHKYIDPTEGIYKQHKRYTLLEKWINIAKMADANSKIFVMHAIDDYSPPKRLFIHYQHFKNINCHYSTQLRGYFYNVHDNKYMLFEGPMQEADPNKITRQYLNNAALTKDIRNVKLPEQPQFDCIDSYLFRNIMQMKKINPADNRVIFTDIEIDIDNWKYGLFTDGFNTISIYRRELYNEKKFSYITPFPSKPNDLKISTVLISKLRSIK